MDLVLIRHPQVTVDQGVCYGRSDVPLAGNPDAAAAAMSARLADLGAPVPQRIETSPRLRCQRVAAALAALQPGCPAPHEDERLAELDFGDWEGRPWDQVDRHQLDAWAADFYHAREHGGESIAQFDARVRAWLNERVLGQAASFDTPSVIWALTHAGVMRSLIAHGLGLPLEQCMRWPLEFSGIAWLRRDAFSGQWLLVRWNV